MNIYTTVLIAVALVLEKIDKKITEERNRSYEEYLSRKRTQKPLREPLSPSPSKYQTVRIDTSSEPPARPYMIHVNHNTGIITSTTATSKYTPEQLQSFYKINPYTNL